MTVTTPSVSPVSLPPELLGALPDPAAARNIEGTAKQLESLFLSMLLKEMRQSLEPDGLFAGDSGDVHGGLFDLYLGQHLADAGGVGLAASLKQQLGSTSPANAASTTSPARR